jgi:delta1-piperideine-2-carboxylate reductase
MKLSLDDAKKLGESSLQALGYNPTDAAKITHHIIDSEERGYHYAGLARILSIADRLRADKQPSGTQGSPACTTRIARETPSSAQIDGNDTLGYLVALEATELACRKATETGIAVVGANNTWYTGMLSYYAEICAKHDLVCMIASNATPWVAPHGGYEPLFGTNPICIGFPTNSVPVIWDIGTSPMIHAQAVMAQRLSQQIPPNMAYNNKGELTLDPTEALGGAFTVWGGHKGSGLAVCVQLLGVLAGSPAMPPNLKDFGFLVVVIKPDLFRPLAEFKKEVEGYGERMKGSKTLPGEGPLRMPFERSDRQREQVVERGWIEIDEDIVKALEKLG